MAAANNEQGATRLFKNRKQYHKSAWTSMKKRPTPIDLWYDKPFYGRMDADGNAISLNSAYLKQLSTDSKNVFVLNFVADAYRNMIDFYNIGVNIGKVKTEGSSLVTIEAKDGWYSPDKRYELYLSETLFKTFNASFLAKGYDDKISNFDDFLHYFKMFVFKTVPTFPFTKVAYLTSTQNDPITSGLMIEIAEEVDFGDDQEKYDSFINDPNFNFYLYSAQRYGFKVDKNAPWRLVADLGSPIMQKFIENYPLPPEPPAMKEQDYFSGDIVEVPLLSSDPTILDKSTSDSRVVRMRVREYDPVDQRAFLSPLPGYENHPATTGNLYEKYQRSGVGGRQLEVLFLVKAGADRLNYSNVISKYRKDVDEYLKTEPLNVDNLFERYYNKAYLVDIEQFRDTAMRFYNAYVNTNPTVTRKEYCTSRQRSITEVIRRFPVNVEQISINYQNNYWLKMYAEVRAAELEWKPSKQAYNEFITKIDNLYKFNGLSAAVSFMNLKLNGIFQPKIGLTKDQKNDINLNKSNMNNTSGGSSY